MRFEFGFYSSLLLIFFFHGLVYAFLLIRRGSKKDSSPDKWLAFFLILCVLYISPWMLGFGGWYDNQPYRDLLFYIPMQHLFFIGPVIFFYVQSLLNPSFKFGKREMMHLVPGLLYLTYSLVIFITDQIVLKKYYFLADGADRDFDGWYQTAGLISMVIYFILSLRYYQLYKKLMQQVISYVELVLFKWVRNFLLAFLSMQVLHVLFFLLAFLFPKLNSYIGTWWYFFSFSIIFYYIAINGYANSIETKVPFKLHLLNDKPSLLLQYAQASNTGTEYLEDAEIIDFENGQTQDKEDGSLLAEWKTKIKLLLEEGKVYEDPELSLTQLAKSLKTNPSVLSKVINQGFQQNFNDFINDYRVNALKKKLQAGEYKTQTLLGMAYDCGFNSKATFNRAFKKATGVTPKEWIGKSN